MTSREPRIEPGTVRELLDVLGREKVRLALGVEKPSIKAAISKGVMSGHWFGAIEKLCNEQNVRLSRELFNFRYGDDGKVRCDAA